MYYLVYEPDENPINNPEQKAEYYRVVDASELARFADIIWKNDTAKTELAANEILLPVNILENTLPTVKATVDYTAFHAALSALGDKLDVDAYLNAINEDLSPVNAIQWAYYVKYIKNEVAANAAVRDALAPFWYDDGTMSDEERACNYWMDMWRYGYSYEFLDNIADYTYKTKRTLNEELLGEIYGNAAVKAAVLEIFGIPATINASAEAAWALAKKLPSKDGKLEINYWASQSYIQTVYLMNYIVANDYHLKENYQTPFVQSKLENASMYSIVDMNDIPGSNEWSSEDDYRLDNAKWCDLLNNWQRLAYFADNSYAISDISKDYNIPNKDIYMQIYQNYFALTGTSFADVFTLFDGFDYQLEVQLDGESTREVYKVFEDTTVVGFFFDSGEFFEGKVISSTVYNEVKTWKESRNELDDMIVMDKNPGYQEDRVEHTPGMYYFAVAAIAANDEAAIAKLVEMSYADEHTTDYLYEMQNAVMYTLGSFNEIIEILAKVFVWVGLALAVFSSLLLMNFISTSISYKKREIGILRAVGAKSSDVFKIFFSEAFIIAFINFLLATATSIAAVIVLNFYMRNSGINITLLSFGPVQIAIMLGVSIVVAALASFLPVYGIARKKPVDAIKDR